MTFRCNWRIGQNHVLLATCVIFAMAPSAKASDYFQGFEADTDGWDVFPASGYLARVPSSTNSIPSASGSYHAEVTTAFTRWGGYNDGDDCSSGCSFPATGYETAVKIYLDPANSGYTNDMQFDFSSAVNNTTGTHRRDYIFNCGFYNDAAADTWDVAGPRFVCSASHNAPGWPKNPGRDPQVVATSAGWYEFVHTFEDDGAGFLKATLQVLDPSGVEVASWILDGSPTPDAIVDLGGNRYGWFTSQRFDFPFLAIDDSRRSALPGPAISCIGFEAPLDRTVSVKKGNRTLPFKMQLVDGGGNVLSDLDLDAAPVISIEFQGGGADPTPDDLKFNGPGDEGNQFSYDAGTQKWQFNLSTKGFSAPGTYEVTVISGDNPEYVVDPTCTGHFTIQ